MSKDVRCVAIFLSMVLLVPLLFGVAYFIWPVNYGVAIAVLFVGLGMDILGGFELLDHALSGS